MNNAIDFLFPKDTSDEWNGFNDPGMEHFRGNPYIHLGKEVTQNTLDAIHNEPAKIKIKLLHIETKNIPSIETLQATMVACLKSAKDESPKAVTFFENAIKLLKKTKVPVLEISDENTFGVVGPCTNGQPYFAFMKAIGQTKRLCTESA